MDTDDSDDDDGWSARVRIITPIDMDATVTISDGEDETSVSHCCLHNCHRIFSSSRSPSPPSTNRGGNAAPPPSDSKKDHAMATDRGREEEECQDCKDSHILEWSGGPSMPRTYREICPTGQCDNPASSIDSSLPRPYNPPNPTSSDRSSSDDDQEVGHITIRQSPERDVDRITIRARSRSPDRLTVSVTDHHCCPEHPCDQSSQSSPRSSPRTPPRSPSLERVRILVDSEVDIRMGQLRNEIGALDDRLGERIERAIDSVVSSKLMDITDSTSERVLRRINCMIDCKMREVMDMANCSVNSRIRDALEAVMKDLQRCKHRLNS